MKESRVEKFIELLHSFPPWLRKTIGGVLVVLGIFGFLPIIGFWMIPLGLVVLSADYRFARFIYVNLRWNARRIRRWKRQKPPDRSSI